MLQLKERIVIGMIVFLSITSLTLNAQPTLDDENVLDNPVPFDGGISCLVAATIVYGLSKVRRKEVD